MEVSAIRLNVRVEADNSRKITADSSTQQLRLEAFPMATALLPYKAQTTRGIALAIEADVRNFTKLRWAITDGSKASSAATPSYGLEKSAIITDLSTERPQWILSAYGPGRGAPAQLFGGPQREQSFEELRLLHYMGLASGNAEQAAQEADKLYQAAEQQMRTALNDVDGAINYIIKAENEHPNRIDICRESQVASAGLQPNPFSNQGSFQPAQSSNPFGAPSQSALVPAPAFGAPSQTGAFGQPSALGQRPSPFGAVPQPGAFGQPSGGTFSQPLALGQKPNPFGAATPAFGATTKLGVGGAFGQPSALGQKPNPFGTSAQTQPPGAPTQVGSGGAFGQPSSLGQKPNPFGGSSQSAAPTPFGGASQQTQANPFGVPSSQNQNSFGPQNPSAQPNPFGSTTATPFGAPSPASKNPFGAASQPTNPNPFAGPPTAQTNPFGATPAPAASNPFGNPNPNPLAAPSPFGKPLTNAPPSTNPFGAHSPQTPQLSTNGFSSSDPVLGEHPPLSSYCTKDRDGRLLTFKGKPVVYKESEPGTQNQDGTWEKIWFPDGPPGYNKTAEASEEKYTEEIKIAYEKASRTGVFEWGIPLVPPKQEWCLWDF
jgi:nucleoporin NUP42